MNRKTVGHVIRQRRERLALTQRALAAQVGVKASHIAYIEGGQRRASLSVLARIASELGLDSTEVFLLSYPEAKCLLKRFHEPGRRKSRHEAFRQFSSNRALLERHRVSRGELKILKQVSLLRRVACARHFLFILNSIRQAAEED
jgi:transcriptional regulator with XRE-family HTH domain